MTLPTRDATWAYLAQHRLVQVQSVSGYPPSTPTSNLPRTHREIHHDTFVVSPSDTSGVTRKCGISKARCSKKMPRARGVAGRNSVPASHCRCDRRGRHTRYAKIVKKSLQLKVLKSVFYLLNFWVCGASRAISLLKRPERRRVRSDWLEDQPVSTRNARKIY